jgi:predicted nucleotidyltransferase component of viral defense system
VTVAMPPVPNQALLADLCREAAAKERVQPQLIEKDFYLTRIIWGLGQVLGDRLLLKGGTLLSKVDLGFFRMSEDADFVLPGTPSKAKRDNILRIHEVRDALKTVAPAAGVTVLFPAGQDSEKGSHCIWQLDYPSDFGRMGVKLEVSIRPLLRKPRKVPLRQLLDDPMINGWQASWCCALDEHEARAEKVRAAFTRNAIRDFYDLERLLDLGVDLSSASFKSLVDLKLAELHAPPLAAQARSFGLVGARRRELEAGVRSELAAVLRADAPSFDLDAMSSRFDKLWHP